MARDRLSTHFYRHEFACPCGCGLDSIDLRLMPILEIVRHYEADRPLVPTSACRCKAHNERVKTWNDRNYKPFSSRSKHMDCIAVDVPSKNPYKLYRTLNILFPGMYGIGVYDWGVHIDVRLEEARWDKRT